MAVTEIWIRSDRRAGDDALIVELHRLGYRGHGPRFGPEFAEFVAETVAEAGLDDPSSGSVWFAHDGAGAVGCSALINRGDRGQLRWVIVLPRARGLGLGMRLTELALDHAEIQPHHTVFLETTDGLEASMAIYQKLGFVTTHAQPTRLWHGEGVHIVMERRCLRSSEVTSPQSADKSHL